MARGRIEEMRYRFGVRRKMSDRIKQVFSKFCGHVDRLEEERVRVRCLR